MKKLAFLLAVLLLTMTSALLLPQGSAEACNGTSCRGLDPIDQGCSNTGYVYTVYEGMNRKASGSYGQVETDLRYSTNCHSNWSRGRVKANNSDTKYLYAKAVDATPAYNYYFWIQGNPLAVEAYCWTDMVNGYTIATAFAGIAKTSWSGPYNPSFQYSG